MGVERYERGIWDQLRNRQGQSTRMPANNDIYLRYIYRVLAG